MIKRIVSGVLIICMLFMSCPFSFVEAEDTDPVNVVLSFCCNTISDRTITGLYKENVLYVDINKLSEIVRGEITSKNEKQAEMLVGVREFFFDVSNGTMTDKLANVKFTIDMPIIYCNNEIYVSALNFLKYYGAEISIDEESEINFMVYVEYDISHAVKEYVDADCGGYFWWDEMSLSEGESLESKILNAGIVSLINRDSNFLRMAFDAKGIEREAVEDALLTIVKNEGIDYLDYEYIGDTINNKKDILSAELDYLKLIKDAYFDPGTTKSIKEISDVADEYVDIADGLLMGMKGLAEGMKAMEAIKQYQSMTTAQKDLLSDTIIKNRDKSETLKNNWDVIYEAAIKLDASINSEYAAGFIEGSEALLATVRDTSVGLSGTALGIESGVSFNPVEVAYNTTIVLMQNIPYTKNIIDRKDKLYNAYNASIIQLVSREMLYETLCEWYYSDSLYMNPEEQYNVLYTLKQLLVLNLKSTLTTREYLIASGYLDKEYTEWNKEINKKIAPLLNKIENCKLNGVNLYDSSTSEDLSWLINLKQKRISEIRCYDYRDLEEFPSTRSVFIYNEKGQIIEEHSYNSYDGGFEIIFTYTYDDYGRMIKKESDPNNEEYRYYHAERTYDDDGRLIYTYDDDMGSREYIYSDDGRITNVIERNCDCTTEMDYSYEENEDGSYVERIKSVNNYSEGEFEERFKCDASGRRMEYLDAENNCIETYDYPSDPIFDIMVTTREYELDYYVEINLLDTAGQSVVGLNLYNDKMFEFEYENGYLKSVWSGYEYIKIFYEGDSEGNNYVPPVYGSIEDMPNSFVYASGVGGWSTGITINEDWTFEGGYYDYEYGYDYEYYYACDFTGKFSVPQKVNEYTYSMNVLELNYDHSVGKEYVDENGIHCIVSAPYGLEEADEVLIFLPGTKISNIPDGFLGGAQAFVYLMNRITLPSGLYGLYSVNDDTGFSAMNENSRWYGTNKYTYTYKGNESSIYCNADGGYLSFYLQEQSPSITITYIRKYDEQEEFIGYDYNDFNKGYSFKMSFSEDFSSMTIDIDSRSRTDLTMWGGTADGHLTATYILDDQSW